MGASLPDQERLSPFSSCRLSPVVCRATRERAIPARYVVENEKAWNGGKAFDKYNFRLGHVTLA